MESIERKFDVPNYIKGIDNVSVVKLKGFYKNFVEI